MMPFMQNVLEQMNKTERAIVPHRANARRNPACALFVGGLMTGDGLKIV
jgi:hypothetical protein